VIRREFVAGNTHGVLKQAVRPLATPLVDRAVEQIGARLDGQGRLDVIHRISESNQSSTEEELRADIDEKRRLIVKVRTLVDDWALVLVIGGAALMVLVHWPSLSSGLRRAGITLFLSGLGFFLIGKVLEILLPDRLAGLVELGAGQVPGVPPSIVALSGDLIVSFGQHMTEGFAGPALAVLVAGAVLFGASFLVFILRPVVPGLR
jgi:hypothetical protein